MILYFNFRIFRGLNDIYLFVILIIHKILYKNSEFKYT